MSARDVAETLGGKGHDGDLRFDLRRDLVATADESGHLTSLNRAWETATGWTRAELMAQPFTEFVHPDDTAATLQLLGRWAEEDLEVTAFHHRLRRRDGSYVWLRWHGRTDGAIWIGVAVDVTTEHEAEVRIRRAIAEDRLLVYAQPILDRATGDVVQEELLVRMRENGRVLTPGSFLPAAERGGAITILDLWMVGRALELAGQGRAVAVNLSPRTLGDPALMGELTDLLASRPGHERITLEITETAALASLPAATELAAGLRRLGCEVALDDFGTGSASFVHLRELPISSIKIDRRFIAGLPAGGGDRAVCRALTVLARELGVLTVAEGVETQEMLDAVHELGADRVQGYLCGRPAPA